jgi:hypothetical protein
MFISRHGKTSQKTRTFISTCGNLKPRISIPVPQCMLHRWIIQISSASAPAIMNMNAFFSYSTICFAFPSCLRCTDRGNFTTHTRINSAEDRSAPQICREFSKWTTNQYSGYMKMESFCSTLTLICHSTVTEPTKSTTATFLQWELEISHNKS